MQTQLYHLDQLRILKPRIHNVNANVQCMSCMLQISHNMWMYTKKDRSNTQSQGNHAYLLLITRFLL